jgi:hypothetical protein
MNPLGIRRYLRIVSPLGKEVYQGEEILEDKKISEDKDP